MERGADVKMDDGENELTIAQRSLIVIASVTVFAAELPITVEMKPYKNLHTGDIQGVVLTDLFAAQPGNGVGSAVVREMLRLAEVADVTVYTDADGPQSAEFYRKMGFERSSGQGHQFAWYPPLPAYLTEDDDAPGSHREARGPDFSDAERRQMEFDGRLDAIRQEGAEAFRNGLSREDCPYLDDPEPHHQVAWIGGMAEAALGLDEPQGPTP